MKFYFALWLAKLMGIAIKLVSKGRGTNLPGEKALAIDPDFVKHFKNIDYSKVVFITGTNGKSSTTNLLTHILKQNGKKIVSNLEGANLLGGIATSLAKEASLSGKLKADFYIFETDERPITCRKYADHQPSKRSGPEKWGSGFYYPQVKRGGQSQDDPDPQ